MASVTSAALPQILWEEGGPIRLQTHQCRRGRPAALVTEWLSIVVLDCGLGREFGLGGRHERVHPVLVNQAAALVGDLHQEAQPAEEGHEE